MTAALCVWVSARRQRGIARDSQSQTLRWRPKENTLRDPAEPVVWGCESARSASLIPAGRLVPGCTGSSWEALIVKAFLYSLVQLVPASQVGLQWKKKTKKKQLIIPFLHLAALFRLVRCCCRPAIRADSKCGNAKLWLHKISHTKERRGALRQQTSH